MESHIIPETEEEKLEIEKIIQDFERKNRAIDFSKLKTVDNRKRNQEGFWFLK